MSLLAMNQTLTKSFTFSRNTLLFNFFVSYKRVLGSVNTVSRTHIRDDYKRMLNHMRTDMLAFLQPKMLSSSSDEDSPLCSLPLVIRSEQSVYERVEVQYSCHFKCEKCQFERKDG